MERPLKHLRVAPWAAVLLRKLSLKRESLKLIIISSNRRGQAWLVKAKHRNKSMGKSMLSNQRKKEDMEEVMEHTTRLENIIITNIQWGNKSIR